MRLAVSHERVRFASQKIHLHKARTKAEVASMHW